MSGRLPVLLIVAALVLAGGAAEPVAAKDKPKDEDRWVTYDNPRFGYSLYYPSAIFDAQETPEDRKGRTFASKDGRAKIVVFGAINDEELSPNEYRRVLLEEFGGYDKLDYQPLGKTWFVLSGFRGENIYYQKVMFSCANQVINVFSVTFPTDEKPFYEGLIEIMEDRFRPGRGAETPEGC
jgi:hypothetical protein